MGSLTSWSRLEPQSNDPELGSLAARIADPLWLLARQWQFGEWQGEDTGSPVEVRVRYEAAPLTRYAAGPRASRTPGLPLPADRPLDTLVERERTPEADRRLAVLAGRRFLDALGPRLASRYQAQYVAQYPLTALTVEETAASDNRTLRVVGLLAGRAVDGFALQADLTSALAAGSLPFLPDIDTADVPAVTAAARTWLAWFERRFGSSGPDAWQPDRLAYEFAVAAPAPSGEVVLRAPAHRGGRIDWTTFDARVGDSLGADADGGWSETTFAALPTGLAFPGMPAARWWQIESNRVDFGGLDTAPDDLGRLLLAEFALVYGNDFFALPLRLRVGTLCRISQLELSTTFGETIVVPPVAHTDRDPQQRWRMFEMSADVFDSDAPRWMLVPPSALDVHESEALESVLFSRDEMSNIAWAVEQRIVGPAGSGVDRRETYHRATPAPEPPAGQPRLEYQLATPLAPHWLPLVPVASGPGQTRLELRGLHAALGRLLSGASFGLVSQELPRAGLLVERRERRSRWTDGSTHVWTARRVRNGRGESSAGLRFDAVEPA